MSDVGDTVVRADPRVAFQPGRTFRQLAAYGTVGVYLLAAPFGWAGAMALDFVWRHDELERMRRMQRLTTGAYRLMHDWLRFLRVADYDHRAVLRDVPTHPCVIVANHPTLMDITAICAALGRGFTIVKPELHSRRLLRPFMVGAGHVAGASADPASTGRVVDEAVARLRKGSTLIVFPEGTRSPAGGLRPFGRTAFEVACRARVPVVSLTIDCTPLFLSKGASLFRAPDVTPRFELQRMAVDDPADCGYESRALLQRVEDRYRARLAAGRLAGIPGAR